MITKDMKISIIGLGLLGGSYAEGFKEAGYDVYGLDKDEDTIAYAKEKGWIKDGSTDPEIVRDSDIVISAMYPKTFIQWIEEHQDLLKPGSILTDVTGVKRNVIKEINEILRPDVEYIAAHPMAGREFKGIRYADNTLFHKANYIIVATDQNSERAKEAAKNIAEILQFKHISTLSPEKHDRMIGFLSQLTHVIAVSLMNVSDDPSLVEYTGDSFRDLTRIANINADLWPELFVENKDYLLEEIDAFTEEMNAFRVLLETEDIEGMKEKMEISTARRKAFDK